MSLTFTRSCLSKDQGDRVIILLNSMVKSLVGSSKPLDASLYLAENGTTLRETETVSIQDLQDIWKWNFTVPEPSQSCVHDLFTKVALRQPNMAAVCAWDGDWTYGDLHEISTRLAFHIMSLGVGVGTVVPLCFEKSKWMPIAILAVMKAGGILVALDTTQPENRLRSIVQQFQPALMLTSPQKQELANRLTDKTILILNDANVTQLAILEDKKLPAVQSSDTLYIAFTSGSTGLPKGAIITHSNFTSSVRDQQIAHGFDKTSRVYDFASYAFDISWHNSLNALTCGGCLCIPSEADRINDLPGSIQRLGATYATLTPSTARILPAATIQSLKVLSLAGEPLAVEDAKRWAAMVDTRNFYGPCECTPATTIATVESGSKHASSIGRGAGVNTWVVRPSDHDYLVPIGTVGELVIEGPLVGAGYFGEEEKTKAAFLNDPLWLLRGTSNYPGRRGRVYKTGDLVQYSTDGRLTFIGRKDEQVKVHGQRVELSEIENSILRHESVRQFACLLPKSGPFSGKLIGIYSLETNRTEGELSTIAMASGPSTIKVEETLQALLEQNLPSYMCPSVWIGLEYIPMNVSRKMDKKKLMDWLSGMEEKTYAKICHLEKSTCRDPATTDERLLREACSLVLSISVSNINLDRSFIANGGDSISAMRLVSQCRGVGIATSVTTILRSESLAIIASSVNIKQASDVTVSAVLQQKEDFNVPFGLSPIQQWFLDQLSGETIKPSSHYFNQGFYVQIHRQVSSAEISGYISKIVNHHSMLRARFQKSDNGGWVQQVLPPTDDDSLHYFESADVDTLSEISSRTAQMHQSLDIENGPLFAASLYSLQDGAQYLIMVAHHLVIDLVSWRIILQDLQTLFQYGALRSGLPFQTWNKLQSEKARTHKLDPEHVLPIKTINNNLEFWGYGEGTHSTYHSLFRRSVEIDEHITSMLLREANDAFATEPVDLILSAIWDAFFCNFSEREELTIFNEAHGREPWSDEIDLTETVGWFTTMSPLQVSRRTTGSNLANIPRIVKDQRKRLPSNGWAYFASRYLNENGVKEFQDHRSAMEVVFNYSGQFQQLEDRKSLFTKIKVDGVSDVGPALLAPALITINATITNGQTRLFFAWNPHIAHQDRINAWIDQIAPTFQSLCNKLSQREKTSRTLCDYNYLDLDYRGLDELENQIIPLIESTNSAIVDDVYPCSTMVDGMLLSQIQEPRSYKTAQSYTVQSSGPEAVCMKKLVEAWQRVVARHPALRTVFIEAVDSISAFNQIVLQSYCGEVVLLESHNEALALEMIQALPPVDYRQLKPPHRLTLCQIPDERIICRIEMSHAITDGGSTSILVDDWAKSYAGTLDLTSMLNMSRDFAQALMMTPTADKMAFWEKKLGGTELCHFPSLSHASELGVASSRASINIGGQTFVQIQKFCEEQSVTPASLFQSAWALTLSAYTGTDSVCFGYLASGRDIPVDGITEAVGAYANMLICRADISREWTGPKFVKHIHDQVIGDLSFQHCSLADVQHKLGVLKQGLFNTIISFQVHNSGKAGGKSENLKFTSNGGNNLTEVSI